MSTYWPPRPTQNWPPHNPLGDPAPREFVSAACEGEVCRYGTCTAPAVAKVEEAILFDDPNPGRHPLTAYICADHFGRLMRGAPDDEPKASDALDAAFVQASDAMVDAFVAELSKPEHNNRWGTREAIRVALTAALRARP